MSPEPAAVPLHPEQHGLQQTCQHGPNLPRVAQWFLRVRPAVYPLPKQRAALGRSAAVQCKPAWAALGDLLGNISSRQVPKEGRRGTVSLRLPEQCSERRQPVQGGARLSGIALHVRHERVARVRGETNVNACAQCWCRSKTRGVIRAQRAVVMNYAWCLPVPGYFCVPGTRVRVTVVCYSSRTPVPGYPVLLCTGVSFYFQLLKPPRN